MAVCCAAGAAFCYGVATHYTRLAKSVAPYTNAHGSMWTSTLMLAPVMLFMPVQTDISLNVAAAVLALGGTLYRCSLFALFPFSSGRGATPALTVTFLFESLAHFGVMCF